MVTKISAVTQTLSATKIEMFIIMSKKKISLLYLILLAFIYLLNLYNIVSSMYSCFTKIKFSKETRQCVDDNVFNLEKF